MVGDDVLACACLSPNIDRTQTVAERGALLTCFPAASVEAELLGGLRCERRQENGEGRPQVFTTAGKVAMRGGRGVSWGVFRIWRVLFHALALH